MWPLLLLFAGCSEPQTSPDAAPEPTFKAAVIPHLQTPSETGVNPSLGFKTPSFSRPQPAPTIVTPSNFSPAPPHFSGPPLARDLPSPPLQKTLQSPRIAQLKSQIARYGLFAAYRELASLHQNAGLFDEAARLNREQAALYRQKKLEDAAIIADNQAGALENQLRLFVETQTTSEGAASQTTSAVNEPVTGCYLGAFIDRDDSLGEPFWEEDRSQWYRAPEQWMSANRSSPRIAFHLSELRPAVPARVGVSPESAGHDSAYRVGAFDFQTFWREHPHFARSARRRLSP